MEKDRESDQVPSPFPDDIFVNSKESGDGRVPLNPE